ncbi:hypothetical protein V491_04771 [Pseudogymnoascus sp. VKM F-3775]|nr:hypothetical protein V491_04771 [Pseudogymnoascus sp. VKM F-3775]
MAHTDEKKDLEAGNCLPGIESQYTDEKAGLQNSRVQSQGSTVSASTTRLKVITSARMPSCVQLLKFLTILAVFTVSFASAATVRVRKHHAPTADEIQFTKLLATISDDPELHDALEQYIASKYHPGTNGQENTAFQFLNSEKAAVATSLVELVKRQNTNGTTITTTSSITDPPETTTSIVVPPTTDDTPTTITSDTPTTPAPTSTPEPTDTSTESPPTLTPETSETPTTPTPTPPTSTTTKSGPTTPPPTSVQQTKTHTSTTEATTYTTVGPDGSTSTITTYTVVPASQPTEEAAPTVTPGLQGAASKFDVLGTVGYGFILLVGLVAVL